MTYHTFFFGQPNLKRNLGHALAEFRRRFQAEPERVVVNRKWLAEAEQIAAEAGLPAEVIGLGGCLDCEVWLAVNTEPVHIIGVMQTTQN